ncbi:hypothetical protein TNCV_5101201 [Trichonephila clavipes]|nr:hypothetical protein TNCV_5101201 [Trichonephila clavipes]
MTMILNGHGHELMVELWIGVPVSLQTHPVEELMNVKAVEVQSHHIGFSEVMKVECQLRRRPGHLTEV